jgi:hypothetical protein
LMSAEAMRTDLASIGRSLRWAAWALDRSVERPREELSRFQRGGQRMLAMIPYRDRMWETDHGRQVPCCGE